MKHRKLAGLIGIVSLGMLMVPMTAAPAQAAAGTATIAVTPTGTIYDNQSVSVAVDFPTGTYDEGKYGNAPYLVLSTASSEDGSYTAVGSSVKSTSSGTYTFAYTVDTGVVWLQVCSDPSKPNGQSGTLYNNGTFSKCTAKVKLDPQTPPEAGIELAQPAAEGKTFTASFFGAAAKSGQTASLQLETLVTTMTTEVTSASWKTVATAKQTSAGKATFTVSDPYEVSHKYQVITGTSPVYTSNQVTVAATPGAKSTGVPQVYFNSNEGASVNTRTRYFQGQFTFKQADSPEYGDCKDVLDKDGNKVDTAAKPLLAAMKGRGNYSWSFDKKSFTLKLDKKTNFCGMGASKKWALVANHYDKSLLRNTVADFLGSKLTNLAWTPESRPVDLWVNGSYRGSYILIERIAPDDTFGAKRIPYAALDNNVGVTGENTPGFILEWDFRKGADQNVTAGSRGWVGIKDPENDYDKTGANTGKGITSAQKSYIDDYLDDCDAKLFGSGFAGSNGWRSCIDEASAVDYYIGMELMKPVDGNMWASVYMWKPKDGKLQFGPMWDFDLAAGSANRAGGTVNSSGWYLRNQITTTAKQSTKTWFNRLNEDSSFRSKVSDRWDDVKGQLDDSDSFLSAESGKIKASAGENFKKWSVTQKLSSVQVVKGSWSAEVSYLRSWLKARISWMNGNL